MQSQVRIVVEQPQLLRGVLFQNRYAGYVSVYVYPYVRGKSTTKPLLLYRKHDLTPVAHGLNGLERWHFVAINTSIIEQKAFLKLVGLKLVIELRAIQLAPQYPMFGIAKAQAILYWPPDENGEVCLNSTIRIRRNVELLEQQIKYFKGLRSTHDQTSAVP